MLAGKPPASRQAKLSTAPHVHALQSEFNVKQQALPRIQLRSKGTRHNSGCGRERALSKPSVLISPRS